MKKKTARSINEEMRVKLVQLMRSSKNPTEVAREAGISKATLYEWEKKYAKQARIVRAPQAKALPTSVTAKDVLQQEIERTTRKLNSLKDALSAMEAS